ncbi:hypothetical protein NEOKW01_1200 [Nematocida sp. AWRm80]|nr:hypothetical protein NEOKW01_1200 [Nematocida sp. AWRm80]
MDFLLTKQACALLDSATSRRFDLFTWIPNENGLHIQAIDKGRSIVVEHFINKNIFKKYTGKHPSITLPYTKFYLKEMDTLRIYTSGALLKLIWTSSGITLEQSIYILEKPYTSLTYPPTTLSFSLPQTLFLSILKDSINGMELSIQNNILTIHSISSTPTTITTKITHKIVPDCYFMISKYHLDRVPRMPYITLTISVIASNNLILLSLETVGITSTITISTPIELLV